MQVESHPCTKVCTMCTPPLAGQRRDERTLPDAHKAATRGGPSKEFVFVMSSPQLLAMNE
jgi:hypothetical protein